MQTTSTKFKAACGVLGVLGVIGIVAWIFQLIGGLGVTGMNNGTSWGLYITMFMFFVGLSAGGLIVASSASVFHVTEYKKVALPAVILSTICICVAAAFILIDLGGVARIWRLFTGPNFTSPLIWDVFVITAYLIVNIIYLVFMTKKEPDDHAISIVSRFALPIAILVHSVTAWIFGLQLSREGWYSAILAPLFVISAMDSGLALLIISLLGLDKAKVFQTDKKLISSLAGLLATCIAIDGFFVGCEVLTMAYPGAEGAATLAVMASGATAPFFWIEIVVGVIIPFVILVFANNRARMGLVAFASGCVVLGVFCKRLWLLLTSFVTFNVEGGLGVIGGSTAAIDGTGAQIWAVTSSYAPTWVEYLIVIGVISLGALAFILATRAAFGSRAESTQVEAGAPANVSVEGSAA